MLNFLNTSIIQEINSILDNNGDRKMYGSIAFDFPMQRFIFIIFIPLSLCPIFHIFTIWLFNI